MHQSVIRQFEVPDHYWANAPHEVDFVLQLDNTILPIEAKAGENVKAVSIKRYVKEYAEQTPLIVRLSMQNLSLNGRVLNVPLFMIDQLFRLIRIALEELNN